MSKHGSMVWVSDAKGSGALYGGEVCLRPLVEEDAPLLARWLFDPEALHWLQLSEDLAELRTSQAVRERFERMQADPFTETWRIDKVKGRPVGQIELVDIHPLQRRAEVHVCIGEKDIWGRGYGTRAVRRLLGRASKIYICGGSSRGLTWTTPGCYTASKGAGSRTTDDSADTGCGTDNPPTWS